MARWQGAADEHTSTSKLIWVASASTSPRSFSALATRFLRVPLLGRGCDSSWMPKTALFKSIVALAAKQAATAEDFTEDVSVSH